MRYSVKSRPAAVLQDSSELRARTDLECLARRGAGSEAGMKPQVVEWAKRRAPVVAVFLLYAKEKCRRAYLAPRARSRPELFRKELLQGPPDNHHCSDPGARRRWWWGSHAPWLHLCLA